jgi:hypothetical protein
MAAPGFVAHLLAILRQKEGEDEADIDHASLAPRGVDFS